MTTTTATATALTAGQREAGSTSGSTSVLEDEYDKQVRPWLELAEDLRTLSLDNTLQVPQICVMGDQSSGKSSVLEALSGVPFPRGSGLVTRCPCRMVMRRSSPGAGWSATAGTTSGNQSIAADSPEQLTNIIARLMDSLTRSSGGFATEAIVVRLSSPDAPDLTVVDLPGIVRTATAGQSQAVVEEVNSLIEEYLGQERTIILAVIPANQDVATVDILERARRVDPLGERTLGVLTKPDLIGPGNEEEVVAVLTNVRKPLKLGYVMVKNRSQAQIKQKTSGESAKADETRFFSTHPVFSRLDKRLFGIKNLTTSLTKLLVARIQDELAPMKRHVEVLLSKVRADVRAVDSRGSAETPNERQKLLVTITQEIIRHLNDCVRGEYRDRLIVCHPNLRLYTRALVIFQELQRRVSEGAPEFRGKEFVASLATQLDGLRGRELPGFMSAQSFYMFIQEYVDAWLAPARMAAAQTRALAGEVVAELVENIAVSYPVLRDALQDLTASILEQTEDKAVKLLEGLVQREKDPFTVNEFLQAHINKLRYDRFAAAVEKSFVSVDKSQGGNYFQQNSSNSAAAKGARGNTTSNNGTSSGAARDSPPGGGSSSSPKRGGGGGFGSSSSVSGSSWQASKEHVASSLRHWYRDAHGVSSAANAEDMAAILEAYWTLASKRFVDNACMCLDDTILSTICPKLQEKCYTLVHDDGRLESYFAEDPNIVKKRKELSQTLDRLAKANAAMASIQATRTSSSSYSGLRKGGVVGESGGPRDSPAAPGAAGRPANLSVVVRLTMHVGDQGLGLQLADEDGAVVVRGFRPGSHGQRAGVCLGDVLLEINGNTPGSFMATIQKLKALDHGPVALTLERGPRSVAPAPS